MEITINITVEELKELLGIQNKPAVHESREYSPYAAFFDEASAAWTKNPECNKMFLLQQQNYANEKLKAQGCLFLNEVYEMLGLPKTKSGQLVGWIYDAEHPLQCRREYS